MTLFSDPNGAPGQRRGRRGAIAAWILAAVAVVTGVLLITPAPYVIEMPGPAFDTLGTVEIDGETVPMISVPDNEFPTDGQLNLLTVSTLGTPVSEPPWYRVLEAWIDPTQTVIDIDRVYPDGVSVDDLNEQNAQAMQASQQAAIAAALTQLGYKFESTVSVGSVVADTPAAGVLREGDIVREVNGERVRSEDVLRSLIAANGVDVPMTVAIERNGRDRKVEVTPALGTDGITGKRVPQIGIVPLTEYVFPLQIVIQLDNVGGPSGGMMFALGIIDKLTEESLTGGEIIAGTGEITASGDVGPISGVRQKMVTASRIGATWFLAPVENCDEVTGNIPDGLSVTAVDTLQDSVDALGAISSGDGTGDLPTCPAP